MAKRYYTTTKSGEEVEVDEILAKQLVAQGKKKVEDFEIEEYESPSEMRSRAKSEYETDVRNLENQANIEKYGAFFPRAARSETIPQMIGGGVLDIASAPGRFAVGAVAGTGAKLGGGEFFETYNDVASRPGVDPNTNLGSQIIEGAVKDPFAIPIAFTGGLAARILPKIPGVASVIAKSPKLGSALLHGVAGGIENIIAGGIERGVDPNKKMWDPEAMAWEGGLGTILGGAGKAGADWLKGLGNTDIGRALLKKTSQNKLVIGKDGQLAAMIKEGYGVDVVNPNTKRIDEEKLGRFLVEQSRGDNAIAQSKYTRVPQWITNQKELVGEELGDLRELASSGKLPEKLKKQDEPSVADELISEALGKSTKTTDIEPQRLNIDDLMERARQSVTQGTGNRRNIISESQIKDFYNDIYDILPETGISFDPVTGVTTRDHARQLDPVQLQQLNEFLYNAGKESSLKYHPSKEQYATELRQLISDEQKKILDNYESRNIPAKYSSLIDLETRAVTSPVLNPNRPSFFQGGVMATGARGVGSLASKAGELPTAGIVGKRTAKEFLQSAIRTPSRTPEQSQESERNVFMKLKPADQRVFARAQDRLRFDPNDREARQILDSYMIR